MALTITEKWIKERIQLKHDNLEDVRTLTLPGTYNDKVSFLGTSLRNFTRLKNLDLSRNSLLSLEGIEQCKSLEKLNLYYNNLPTLSELFRLRHCQNLSEVDLRLNPVARNEPDYRLFLIHMLPKLERLDDRSVRDSERKAALVHFANDQASDFTGHVQRSPSRSPERKSNPRVNYVQSMTRKAGLDDDDVAVLDLIARTGGDLNQQRQVTGSSESGPRGGEYSPESVKKMEESAARIQDRPLINYPPNSPVNRYPVSPHRSAQPPTDLVYNGYSAQYPHIPAVSNYNDTVQVQPTKNRVQFKSPVEAMDPNLRFSDEIDAYSSYKATATFTPHPSQDSEAPNQFSVYQSAIPPTATTQDHRSDQPQSPSRRVQNEPSQAPVARVSTNTSRQHLESTVDAEKFLDGLCDLADKYWNGAKSLHRNQRFQSGADKLVHRHLQTPTSGLDLEVSRLQQQLENVDYEKKMLQTQLHDETARRQQSDGSQLIAELDQTRRDKDVLQDRLLQVIDENKSLQHRMSYMEETLHKSSDGHMSSIQDSRIVDQLQEQNEKLRQQVESMQIRLKQYVQMQDLTAMLQESHKSLVQTNDQLLKELDETKQRHQHEVKQLHWSYDQLKKTQSYLSTTIDQKNSTLNSDYQGRLANGSL